MTTYIYNKVKKAVKAGMLALLVPVLTNLISSCQDKDWDAPSTEKGIEAYGNKYLKETNLKTIAEVIALYSNEINNNSLKEVKQPMQIKGIVTGNDEEGNIYNSLYIQDNTAAIAISISQSGLYAALPVGQEILIELQGLYVGAYGKQPQIGTTYTNPNKEGATPQVGRMSRYIWKDHYKLIGTVAGKEAVPIEVKWNFNSLDISKDCGKLITLKGVSLADADGKAVFAPTDHPNITANCVNRFIAGVNNVAVRTSTYADFAKAVMPTGLVDITGVATRFKDTWQILMRRSSDITASSTEPAPVATPSGSGTAEDPFNVAGIINETKNLASGSTTDKSFYVRGFVSQKPTFDSRYNSLNYYISDDKEGNLNSFYVYSGKGLGDTPFSSENDLKVGDQVVVYGKITNYNGTIEFQKQNYIVELNGKKK
jgi:DNA/RNA endonuclease YhcR with UshA esterase domain